MCGEDGRQMVVYKLKEEHARKEIGTEKEKREKHRQKGGEQNERKRIVLIAKENDRCTNFRPLIYVRVNFLKRPQLT